jgi:hypothetical protein
MKKTWKCDKCGHEGGNKGDYHIIHENCGGLFCLTTDSADGEEVPDDGVMPDGWYWINDFHRYGWEAVLLKDGLVYRNGMNKVDRLDEITIFKMVKLDLPDSP